MTITELQGKLEVAEVESKTGRKDLSYTSESRVNKYVLGNRVTQLEEGKAWTLNCKKRKKRLITLNLC